MKLDIVTPERRLHSLADEHLSFPADVDRVVIPGQEGQFEVLPGHAPFVTLLGTGVLTLGLKGGRTVDLMVSGGFCEVDRDSVNVLCESAALREEIARADEEAAYTALQRDLAALGPVSADDEEYLRLKGAVDRAATKLTLVK